VDREGPTIVAEADRPASANGWYDDPVTFTFTCGDAVAGVDSCPDPVTLSEPGANQSISASATDKAGNSSSVTVDGINIDTGTPTIGAEALSAPNEFGWYNAAGVTIRFTCADEASGLAHCGTRDLDGAPLNATDEVSFTSEGRDQVVTGTARDLAGHSATADSPPVSIDRTAPSGVAITSSAVLFGSQKLNGTASDALSGVRSVTVTYTRAMGGQQTLVKQADSITCNAAGECTWTAPLPPNGVWRTSAQATDFAGNTSPATATFLLTITFG
jgi:hypothetical protein